MITYSKYSGVRNATIGKVETPIKMIIEHESDLLTKQGGTCEWLFNVEKSNRFGETIVAQNEFSTFYATPEGQGAMTDTIMETSRKFIEHIQFTKEFTITAEMMEDANFGVAADAKRRAESFTRAYYKTRHKICEFALANGTKRTGTFSGASIDLTTSDGIPLFNNKHVWGSELNHGTQSNSFWGNIIYSGDPGERVYAPEIFPERLYLLANKLRNMKDNNGDILGYTADTIILPGNQPKLEAIVKSVCGTDRAYGSANNDINLHFGNWNIVVMSTWQTTSPSLMLMSSEANKNLSGNMFFNRIPLSVSNWVDHHTGNYIWNGRCRFGVGFGNYKHILLATDSDNAVENSDYLG